MSNTEPQETLRINRFLARSGIASRRGAEELVRDGRVRVNGHVETDLSRRIDPARDRVEVDGSPVLLPEEGATIMLHKPAGYVTSMDDPHAEHLVKELIPTDRWTGLFPVGRLDQDTTGILLFTTDGNLGAELLHPREEKTKSYYVVLEAPLSRQALDNLKRGVKLGDQKTAPASIRLLKGKERTHAQRSIGSGASSSGWDRLNPKAENPLSLDELPIYEVTIHEGKKRQIRRMFQQAGRPVIALHRHQFAGLDLGELRRGEWRELTPEEVAALT